MASTIYLTGEAKAPTNNPITSRYHGSSQRALAAAVRNAAVKYRDLAAASPN